MPLHRHGCNSWTNLDGSRKKDEDAANNCHSTRLSAFCQEIQSIRKETQKHERSFVALLPVSGVTFLKLAIFINHVYLFCSDVEIGDVATVGECRPLSKTVKFNVLKVSKVAGSKKKFQKF